MDRCIEWKGAKKNEGYGYIKRNGKNVFAHRLVYEETYGPIPEGMVVRHSCDNPPCVNINHLTLGTQADNIRDMHQRGRARHPTGEDHGRSKLTWDDVRFIRQNYVKRSRVYNLVTLGRKFGVDPSVVQDIIKEKTWKE